MAIASFSICAALDAGQGRTITVDIFERDFSPETVSVQPGDTVHFVNQAVEPHELCLINRGGGCYFQTDRLVKGETADMRVPMGTESGTYEYFCMIHPEMRGHVTVTGGAAPNGNTPTEQL